MVKCLKKSFLYHLPTARNSYLVCDSSSRIFNAYLDTVKTEMSQSSSLMRVCSVGPELLVPQDPDKCI